MQQPPDIQAILTQALQQMQGAHETIQPSLERVVDSEEVEQLLRGRPDLQERLLPYLPEDLQSVEYLFQAIRSPQFRQSLSSLTGALQTENFNAIFQNFGLNPADGADENARGNSVGAYIQAIQSSADRDRDQNLERTGDDQNEGKNQEG